MKVKDIFYIQYGVNLELDKLELAQGEESINFVSRTSQNNGVACRVKLLTNLKPNRGWTLSCAGGGSVLSTFFQKEPYYSGRDLYILIPKKYLNEIEMLYYAQLITANKYRYSYGRQANKTLGDIELPAHFPRWFYDTDIENMKKNSQ